MANKLLFVTKLTDLAKDKQVHIHLVAHPRKTTTFLRKGGHSWYGGYFKFGR